VKSESLRRNNTLAKNIMVPSMTLKKNYIGMDNRRTDSLEIGNGSEHAIQLDLFLYIISELFKYGYIAFVPEFFIESSKRQVARNFIQ